MPEQVYWYHNMSFVVSTQPRFKLTLAYIILETFDLNKFSDQPLSKRINCELKFVYYFIAHFTFNF